MSLVDGGLDIGYQVGDGAEDGFSVSIGQSSRSLSIRSALVDGILEGTRGAESLNQVSGLESRRQTLSIGIDGSDVAENFGRVSHGQGREGEESDCVLHIE